MRGPRFTRPFTSMALRRAVPQYGSGRLGLDFDLRPEALPRGRSDKLLRLRLRVESEPAEESRSICDDNDPRPAFHARSKCPLRDSLSAEPSLFGRACVSSTRLLKGGVCQESRVGRNVRLRRRFQCGHDRRDDRVGGRPDARRPLQFSGLRSIGLWFSCQENTERSDYSERLK